MTPAAGGFPARASPLAGIGCILAGMLFLTMSDALAKWVGEHYSAVQILFMRACLALPFVLVAVTMLGGRRALRTRHPGVHLLRGAINVGSACAFYQGLHYLPLAENTAISFAAPLFVTLLSVLVLKERVDGARWLAVAAGFAGVLVIVRPGAGSFQAAALLPLAAAMLYAVMMLTARAIGPAESMLTTMFYIVAGQLACAALLAPMFWTTPQWAHMPFFLGIAVFSTLGLTLITQGFRIGPASTVAPFDYSGLLWAALMGWLFWREVPDLSDLLGAVFIVGSGLYIAWREARPAHQRRRRGARRHPASNDPR